MGALDKRNSRDNLSSHAGSPDASSPGNEPLEDVMDWEFTAREMSADTLKPTHPNPDENMVQDSTKKHREGNALA